MCFKYKNETIFTLSMFLTFIVSIVLFIVAYIDASSSNSFSGSVVLWVASGFVALAYTCVSYATRLFEIAAREREKLSKQIKSNRRHIGENKSKIDIITSKQ